MARFLPILIQTAGCTLLGSLAAYLVTSPFLPINTSMGGYLTLPMEGLVALMTLTGLFATGLFAVVQSAAGPRQAPGT